MDTSRQTRLRRSAQRPLAAPPGATRHQTELARLVAAHQGFVFKIAREYAHLGIPVEDLVNEGNIGLLQAARRFDSLRGTRFLTYASAWIRKYILAAIERYARLVRLPSYGMRRLRRLLSVERALAQKLGRAPSREELTTMAKMRARDFDNLERCRYVEVPIDWNPPDAESGYNRTLPDLDTPSPEEDLLRGETYRLVHGALSRLSPRERSVLVGRYGLSDGRVRTLREVAEELGLSRERVRQIEGIARRKIARHLSRPPRHQG